MRVAFFAILFLFSVKSYSQTIISGKIINEKNNPVPGASLTIQDSYDGATSDSLGNYKFSLSDTGKQVLIVTAIGYEDYSDTLIIDKEPISKMVTLQSKAKSLDAVVISVGAFTAGDKIRGSVLSSLDVATTASANADITAAIKTLPGTQQVGETEGLFVRGGTANEAKYYFDGTHVNNFYYSSTPGQATRGRFNTFLFKGTTFSSGGYSALYGQALSAVLLLESIDLPEKTSANFGISYLGANAGIQKLSRDKKSSWGVTYAHTNLSLVYGLVKQKFDYFQVPIVNEGDVNFRIKTSPSGMLKYFGSFSSTKVGFRNQDADSLNMKDAFGLNNLNMYHNLSWKERIGNRWKVDLGFSFSNNKDKIKSELQDASDKPQNISGDPLYESKNFNLQNKGRYANAKVVFEKKFGGLNAVRFGSEYNYSNEDMNYEQFKGISFDQLLRENIFAGFAETDIYVTHHLAAKIGARTEHSQMLGEWNLAPRLSFAYQFPDKGQVSLAYGNFYQNPDNKYLPALNAIHFEKATHYILQYQKMTSGRIFRTEAYYKKYDDLVKTDDDYGRFHAINNKGFGDAKGIELFWRDKKSLKNFDYWISYSYLDTKRDFLNYPYSIEPSFAAKHTASLVLKKFVLPLKTQFNASYTFATGRPYYDIAVDNNNNFKIQDRGRTKDYNNLSLSVNYLPNLGNQNAKSFGVLVLSATNVLGFDNIYTYRYSENGKNKIAQKGSAKSFFFIGYFVSIGIDRTEDAINNHL